MATFSFSLSPTRLWAHLSEIGHLATTPPTPPLTHFVRSPTSSLAYRLAFVICVLKLHQNSANTRPTKSLLGKSNTNMCICIYAYIDDTVCVLSFLCIYTCLRIGLQTGPECSLPTIQDWLALEQVGAHFGHICSVGLPQSGRSSRAF